MKYLKINVSKTFEKFRIGFEKSKIEFGKNFTNF